VEVTSTLPDVHTGLSARRRQSDGIDIAPFAPEHWRPEYAQEFPEAAAWILAERPNLEARLPTALVVIPGVDHMFARDRAEAVAPHVLRHLAAE
jgi:hypothetical protein